MLVTIGGDDTLSYSQVLVNAGVPLIAIPKTMDNDVQGTEYCIGFSTAITRAKEAINRQRTTLGSHERIGVFRIFGRDAGLLRAVHRVRDVGALRHPRGAVRPRRAVRRCWRPTTPRTRATTRSSSPPRARSGTGAQMTDVGGADAFGHRHKANVGEALAAEIRERTGIETLASELTYDLRSGEPDSLDSLVATTFANIAMDLIEGGVTGRMVAIQDGKYAHTALPDPALGPRKVDVPTMYNVDAVPAALQRQARRPDAAGRPRLRPSSVQPRGRQGADRAGQGGHVVVAVAAGDEPGLELGGQGADRQDGAELAGEVEGDARGPCGGARP